MHDDQEALDMVFIMEPKAEERPSWVMLFALLSGWIFAALIGFVVGHIINGMQP